MNRIEKIEDAATTAGAKAMVRLLTVWESL